MTIIKTLLAKCQVLQTESGDRSFSAVKTSPTSKKWNRTYNFQTMNLSAIPINYYDDPFDSLRWFDSYMYTGEVRGY